MKHQYQLLGYDHLYIFIWYIQFWICYLHIQDSTSLLLRLWPPPPTSPCEAPGDWNSDLFPVFAVLKPFFFKLIHSIFSHQHFYHVQYNIYIYTHAYIYSRGHMKQAVLGLIQSPKIISQQLARARTSCRHDLLQVHWEAAGHQGCLVGCGMTSGGNEVWNLSRDGSKNVGVHRG